VVFWSLCVEEHFYLVWPAFLKLVRTRHARTVVALMVVVALPLLRHVATGPPMRVHMLSHFRVDSILWGALAALWADELPVRTVRILGGAAAAVAGVLVLRGDLSILPPPSALGASLGYSAIAVAATALVLEAPRLPVLAWPPLVAVGRLSYAMYLVHLVAIDLARFVLHPLQPDTTKLWVTIGLYLAFLVPSIALAAIVHVLVEKPFLALKARLQRTA
jgi:peptidoglycan/LPS O-acetylase OafA/YrhL